MRINVSENVQGVLRSDNDVDNIDWRPIFAQIWMDRKFILAGVIIFVAFALLLNEALGKYWSEGFYRVNNIGSATYKRFQPAFVDVDRLRTYLGKVGVNDREAVTFLEGVIALPSEQLERYIPISKLINSKDSKESGVGRGRDGDLDVSTVFSEISLKIPGQSPMIAQLRSRILAEYFADTFVYADLMKWLDLGLSDCESTVYSGRLEAAKIRGDINDANIRLVALRALSKRGAMATRYDANQLISFSVQAEASGVSKGGGDNERRRIRGEGLERFMSPVAQIGVAESMIIDWEIELLNIQRKQKQNDFACKFYKKAAAIGVETSLGRELMKKLLELRAQFPRDTPAVDSAISAVVDQISYEIEQRQFRYEAGFKFLSGPSLPEAKSKKGYLLVVCGSGAVGIIFMISLSLFVSWWRRNVAPLALSDDNRRAVA